MKRNRHNRNNRVTCAAARDRRGSTLLIVLALLGLLAFTGMVFYTFSAQERSAADFFSEAAKSEVSLPEDPFPWALQQILVGANNTQKASILWSPRGRHSMLRGVVGYDNVPHSGAGNSVIYDGGGLPAIDNDNNGIADAFGSALANPLNFVDSLAAWGSAQFGITENGLMTTRGVSGSFPEPDVDYTYPDINNLFLAYKGWAIRDNGAGVPANVRYERVPVFIPSFFRPGLMKSGTTNGAGGFNTPTDETWWDHSTATGVPVYANRSFRPSEHHIAGFTADGTPIRRYLDATNTADATLVGTYGAFPLRPSEDVNPANFGRMGIFTGHVPGTVTGHDPDTFRLDSDNTGDGIFEGIWLDLGYPVQETASGDLYVTMYSFTIMDLAGLIDLNSHGNIARLNRTETVTDQVAGGSGSSDMSTTFLSASHQGLAPSEVNPIWALAPPIGTPLSANPAFSSWYGAGPTNRLEQANMEWIWLLTGRVDTTVFDGRWGDASALYYHSTNGKDVYSLPRPGRSGNLVKSTTSVVNFGGDLVSDTGYEGFDDNGDALEGVASKVTGVNRGFVHPLDLAGTGSTSTANPLVPFMRQPAAGEPERWAGYRNYSLTGKSDNIANELKFLSGPDQDPATGADNLMIGASFNLQFENAEETVNDQDNALRGDDSIYSAADLIPGHLTSTDVSGATTKLSDRLSNLGVAAFSSGSSISERFTTISNSLRSIVHRHDLGPNLTNDSGAGDDGPRWWEWTADVDGDGKGEFPPQFGTVTPYSATDPFRAVVRRLLTSEAGETRDLINQLPLSLNHILDVNRTSETPPAGTPEFLAYLKRAGMRFRTLTEHPDAKESDSSGTADQLTTIPTVGSAAGNQALRNFPPRTLADREFWARRDRQHMARDIYVLLYTVGGAQVAGGNIVNATGSNAGFGIYTDAELRRMAQFAVNLVDAMDTDDVVTKFEYNKDLNLGWTMDDDPYTGDPATPTNGPNTGGGLYPLDTAARGVVYGVEGQSLSFSETLAARFEDFAKLGGMADDPATPFDDNSSAMQLTDPDTERRDRYVLHLELQNNLPYPVALSANGVTGNATTGTSNQGIWQMVRVDRTGASTAPQATVPTQTMTFMDGNADVAGGDRFTISMAATSNTAAGASLRTDPLGTGNADLYLQPGMATNYPLISPNLTAAPIAAGDSPAPRCDLDTISTSHDSRYLYGLNVTTKGTFLDSIPYNAATSQYNGNSTFGFTAAGAPANSTRATGQGFDVILRRRLNPNLPLATLALNPWIEVDRVRIEFKDLFNFTMDMMGNNVATAEFTQLPSEERDEPLDATDFANNLHPAGPADDRYNTIGTFNDRNSATPFNIWQPHFDRDFASPVELFHLPIVGPKLLTQRISRMRHAPAQQSSISVSTCDPDGNPALIGSAVGMFLQPDVLPVGTDADDNAWYRLLQFVEVPSRVNRMLGNYINRVRLPGKINLNGIRHIEVYAGLLDDGLLADVPTQLDPVNPPTVIDNNNQYMPFMRATHGAAGTSRVQTATLTGYRDRWFEFINERDGSVTAYDPNNAIAGTTTTFWIPGTPNASPFRSLGYRTNGINSTTGSDTAAGDTILRSLEFDRNDGDPSSNRHWLELGGRADHRTPRATSTQREHHQMLARLYNNTTTTSDCFIVYGTAAYFKAFQDPTSGLIRVGGRMGLDFDMDGTEENDAGWEQRAVFIIDRTELINAYDRGTGSFDWQRLIKYRADLASDSQ